MKEFISLLERKIEGCDALGGLEREKAVYQSVLKDYKKQLNLCGVSQQRELLIATFKDLDLEYIQGFDDEEWLANKVIEVINCC